MPRFIEYNDNNSILKQSLIISFLLVAILFAWQGDLGFNLWDEGFLWYGAQRVLLGEVPIRDFMSYEPGRYYWTAAWMSLWGDNGIMALRFASAVFQMLGLAVGLSLVAQSAGAQSKQRVVFLILAAFILLLWMYPRHKLFDVSISIFQIGILAYLISNPTVRRYFLAGLGLGLVAVFGRNHGVYGLVGGLGVLLWLNWKQTTGVSFLRGFVYWSAGIALGFLPVVLMVLLVPGFAIAFWENVWFIFELKATNITLPVPWPWVVNFAVASFTGAIRGVLIGLFFIGLLVFAGLSLVWVVYRKLRDKPVPPALVAAAFLAFPYAHYAFSRADVSHLAQGVFPLLIGCLVILSASRTRIKWLLMMALLAASFWVMHVFHPGWQCSVKSRCVDIEISGDALRVDSDTATTVASLRQLAGQLAPNGEEFIVAPYWPGAYALLERRSPMLESYPLHPRSEPFEKQEIERIKAAKPSFALIVDLPLDGRDDLRFKNTHPLTYQYILDNFDLTYVSKNSAYLVYTARKD